MAKVTTKKRKNGDFSLADFFILKSPRTKKLSLVDAPDVTKLRRQSGVIPNALVSPSALERMFGEEISTVPMSSSERRKRRPRGPSSMFATEDLLAVQNMADEAEDL